VVLTAWDTTAPANVTRLRSTLGCMGISQWFKKLRKAEDDAAIARAQERVSGDSRAEREVWSGDMEGLTTDNRAARRLTGDTQSGLDRLSD
jgi:hypothetical protein